MSDVDFIWNTFFFPGGWLRAQKQLNIAELLLHAETGHERLVELHLARPEAQRLLVDLLLDVVRGPLEVGDEHLLADELLVIEQIVAPRQIEKAHQILERDLGILHQVLVLDHLAHGLAQLAALRVHLVVERVPVD